MNNLDVAAIPTVQASAEEAMEGGYAPPPLPDLERNWAESEDVRRFIEQELLPVLQWCRKDRRTMEEEWLAVRRMVQLEHDEGQRYLGRSNSYIPVYNRTRATLVSQLVRGLFPSDEYMDAIGLEDGMEELARGCKQYMQYELEKAARIRTNLKPFMRQFVDTGISVGKVWYAKEEAKQTRLRLSFKKMMEAMAGAYEPEMRDENYLEGIRFKTRSVFSWYIYPVTADSLRDATLVFEDILVPKALIKAKGQKGLWRDTDAGVEQGPPPEFTQNYQGTVQETTGIPASPGTDPLATNPIVGQTVVTEVWTSLPLPKSAYAAGEDTDMPVPVKVVMAGSVVMEVRRNPYWHQCLPYVCARDEWDTPSFYPKGVGHRIRSLQYLVNDFTNQTNDNGAYALNPVVKVNPSLLSGPLTPLKPGAVWSGTDVDAMAKFDRPPIEQLQYGLQLINMFAGMVQDFGGAPPIIQGVGAGKAGKTATQSQILQRNAMNPLQDIVEDLETDVMNPLLDMAFSLGQQFRDGDSMNSIAGLPLKLPRELLSKLYTLRWMASSQAVNQQQRAQQAMQLLQIVGPLMPLLQMNGYTVDPTPLLRRIYSDGFGFREFDKFVKQAPPQMGMPGMGGPGMPPGAGGPPPPGGGNQYSATENSNEGGGEMVAGEGEDFAAVRDNADDIAGMLGGGM